MSDRLKKPMTREGYHILANEFYQLWKVDRPKIVDGVATAAAEGDRSENAEYIYGKKRLREIDKRLRYLGKLLDDVDIVDRESLRGDTVSFGATVTLRDGVGEDKVWTIVGEGEADASKGRISWLAPVAKALLGKKVGERVEVELGERWVEWLIISLKFGS